MNEIAKIIGTKKAGENAKVEQDGRTIIVTWESGESAKYEDLDTFKAWANQYNRFIDQVVYND